MTKRLEGTVALVTGASSGIGEATACALAAEGAKVAVVARRRDRLDALVAKIQEEGGQALAIEAADVVNISSTAGRVTRPGTVIYSATKFALQAFTEGLRQELLADRVRVSVVEPGTVDTELATHSRDGMREQITKQVTSIERMIPEDIAEAVTFVVTRDRRVAINEMLVRAGAQPW